jgi:uncharacterized protein YkwD
MLSLSRIFSQLVGCIVFLTLTATMSGCHTDETPVPEDVRANLLEQINKLRTTGCVCGNETMPPVKTLTWNTALEDAAKSHAEDMYAHNYFDHLSLDGKSPIQRAQETGYEGNYVGEVIARKYYNTKDVMEGWKQSESHCRALMDSLYYEMGGAKKEDYWVVDLGREK